MSKPREWWELRFTLVTYKYADGAVGYEWHSRRNGRVVCSGTVQDPTADVHVIAYKHLTGESVPEERWDR